MKIGFLGHKRIPGREGGVEVVVEELATRMAEKGHEITAYNRKNKEKKLREYKGVKIKTVPTINKKSLDALIYSFLASVNTLFAKFDVIHFHAIGPAVMLVIPHLFRKKTVVTVHGLNYKTPKWKGFGAKYIKLGEKITAKYADEVIVLSKEIQKYFLDKYGRKTNYIPNGVTLSTIREPKIIKEKFGLEKDSYILFLSRIVPGKGLEHLIEAYSGIDSDKKLVIAGESSHVGEFYENIKDMASKDDRIIFTGFVGGDILDELYSNAFLFVFPSEAEGMPMCLLEAMSYNCPCLVSDISENIEVLENKGASFKVGDIQSLKSTLENQLIEKRIVNTRDYINDKYNWDAIVDETLEIYKNIRRG